MNILDWLRRKSDSIPGEALLIRPEDAVWTARSYQAFAREGYAKNPYVFRAIRSIAQALAGVPVLLYERSTDGPQEIYDHPALDVLRRPNPLDRTYSAIVEAFVSTLLLAGEAYLVRLPEKSRPAEVWLLRPDLVRVYRDRQGLPVRYEYDPGKGAVVNYVADQVLHLRFWHPLDAVKGLSPLEAASASVDLNNAGRSWNASLLQNAGIPAGALKTANELTETQRDRLRAMFRRRHSGPKKAGNVLLLEGGIDYTPIGLDAQELSWLDGLKMSAREVAIAFGVPPELLGDSENKTYSNYQEARRAFYTETVLPLADRLFEELSAFLARPFSDKFYYAYDPDQIEALSEDRNAVWDRVLRGLENSMLTVNEAREAVGYSPLSGGNVRLIPANIIPEDDTEPGAAGQKSAFAKPPERARAWRRVDRARSGYERALERRVYKLLDGDYRAAARAVESGDSWEQALTEREDRWLKTIAAAYYVIVEQFARETHRELTGKSAKADLLRLASVNRVTSWLATEGLRRVRGILETTRQHVARSIAAGVAEGEGIPELAQRVRSGFAAAGRARAIRIARTEVVGASNMGAHLGAEESGLDLDKIWVATADDRTREDHLFADGQRVKLNESFNVGGYQMRYPGDSSMGAPAGEIVNCRCTVVFEPRR